LIGDAQDDAGCNGADNPGDQHAQASVLPGGAQDRERLPQNFFHLLAHKLRRNGHSAVAAMLFNRF
jgi:hypothetical protein